eukprot:CCRYP_003977-RA/>CCRYP_003977-RA protein AED:0.07 eAED:0.07 QI:620/1/1/1/1/1/2/219/292
MSDNTAPRIRFDAIQQCLSDAAASTAADLQCPPPRQHSCAIASARDEVFRLGSLVGKLCASFLAAPYDGSDDSKSSVGNNEEISKLLGEIFVQMFTLSGVCGIDLRLSILKKMELNGRKYPVELCKGKSGKYTKYSKHTGITKTEGQSTGDTNLNDISFESTISDDGETHNDDLGEEIDNTTTIEGVTLLLRQFATERLWNRYHTPRNIALALLGEVGELAELFQWSGDIITNVSANGAKVHSQLTGLLALGWTEEEVDKVGQEIADVSIYLMRLADVCGVSLGDISLKLMN